MPGCKESDIAEPKELPRNAEGWKLSNIVSGPIRVLEDPNDHAAGGSIMRLQR